MFINSHLRGITHKVTGLSPDKVIEFFNLPNPYSRTMALEFTQPLREMGTRNRKKKKFLGSRVWPVHEADNLTATCEPTV
jgi:hypothetical protein